MTLKSFLPLILLISTVIDRSKCGSINEFDDGHGKEGVTRIVYGELGRPEQTCVTSQQLQSALDSQLESLSSLWTDSSASRDTDEDAAASLPTPVEYGRALSSVFDCSDIKEFNSEAASGIYEMSLPKIGKTKGFCHMEDGRGWTVLMKRSDSAEEHEIENFDRGYEDYFRGFGNFSGEFWLGLDKMHSATKLFGRQRLKIVIKLKSGVTHVSEYKGFQIGDMASRFRMTLDARISGTIADSFSAQKNLVFTARDQDNDSYSLNCAAVFLGGWWYSQCHSAMLTAPHFSRGLKDGQGHRMGIWWNGISTRGNSFPIAEVTMMVTRDW